MKTLLVYYSRSGNTRKLAQQLAEQCGADIEQIIDQRERTGLVGYFRSALEALLGIRPPIHASKFKPQDYELIVIGGPIWFWNMASPVRSYVVQHGANFNRVAFFLTCGGSGQEKVFADLERLCGRRACARLALTEHQLHQYRQSSALGRFVKKFEQERASDGGEAGGLDSHLAA
ncbi:flavodoxin family protein [Roseateles oligotrophus]|uniref:Flavodoxin n=1 Tax=Roseateles oligotrophus TaxID=1769250 RepID=A0ABT2YML7_9BURK|nr:flavodoxin [Roseateles oligotrophus]MCV2371301.1 flavodoxin [Roseateles oligotrophus]